MSRTKSDSFLGLFSNCSTSNIARRAQRRLSVRTRVPPKPKKQKRPRKPLASPKRDEVAELLSLGFDLTQIAETTQLTRKAVSRHFEKIRKDLGWQAA